MSDEFGLLGCPNCEQNAEFSWVIKEVQYGTVQRKEAEDGEYLYMEHPNGTGPVVGDCIEDYPEDEVEGGLMCTHCEEVFGRDDLVSVES